LLVFERVLGLAVETTRVSVNDLNVFAVAVEALQMSQIGDRGPLQKCRAILVNAVQPCEKIGWKGNGCLDSHKMIILRLEVPQEVLYRIAKTMI
jgi:hypothetical protein